MHTNGCATARRIGRVAYPWRETQAERGDAALPPRHVRVFRNEGFGTFYREFLRWSTWS
jgi:hypothetical protein